MKTIILFALVALAIAGTIQPHEKTNVVEKDVLVKMKKVLRLLMHVHQPSTFKDEKKIAKIWKFEENLNNFDKPEYVKKYVALLEHGTLPRGHIFSDIDDNHISEAIILFRLFYNANDFDTFYNLACWARNNVNEGIFLYSFMVALKHRKDCQGLVLPPVYEVIPHHFINEEAINEAFKIKLTNINDDTSNNDIILEHNYTQWNKIDNPEQKISYFIEDIDVALYYYNYHLDYPAWMEEEYRGFKNDNSGELFVHTMKMLLARYYMERLNNGLGKIEHIYYTHLTNTAYVPFLRHKNGHSFVTRPKSANVLNDARTLKLAERINTYEQRMSEAVDSRLVITDKTRKVPLTSDTGINTLGHMIYGQVGHVLRSYYGQVATLYQQLLSFSDRAIDGEYVTTGALQHDSTAVRDPMFYRIYKHLFGYVNSLTESFPKYTYEQFDFPGVEIQSVDIETIITFDESFDVDITNAVYNDIKVEADQETRRIKVRKTRLNHKPFTYKIHVNSKKNLQGIARVFIAPKYDEFGQLLQMNDNYVNFLELDKFLVDIKEGQNVITRNSKDSHRIRSDHTSFMKIYQNVLQALDGKEDFVYDYSRMYCGVPDRLFVPKSLHGTTYHFFVMLTSAENIKTDATYTKLDWCRVGTGHPFFDDKPLGYPFNRPLDYESFYTPNMRFTDVELKHKSDINRIQP